ncbi:MAG TPA: J domain-containing protein [Myxococcaceae bacterium]|nr:J domain-containing protein [Myxococcaceae bacterium]
MSAGPFEVLGLRPTLDPAEVKKGYFAALARHPPHADAEGFQAVRAAYEALSRPGGLMVAYLSVPFELQEELARWRELFDARLAEAGAAHRRRLDEQHAAERFAEGFSRLSWEEALEAGKAR